MFNKKGDGYISTCVLIVILCMLISVFVTFVSAVNIVRQTKRNARVVLDGFVMTNSIEIYDSIKNGNDHTEEIDASEYINEFSSFNSLDLSNGMLYCYDDDGNELYRITAPDVSFVREKRLKIKSEFVIIIPIYFAGIRVTEATVPIKVVSLLTEKY